MKERKTQKRLLVRSRHFLTILLSVFLVTALVLVIISVVSYHRFAELQRDAAIRDMKETVSKAEAAFSGRMLDMLQLSIAASTNPNFAYYPEDDSTNAVNELVSQLQNYAAANRFYRCIGFSRSSEPNRIYTSLGAFSVEEFQDYIFSFPEHEPNRENIFLSITKGKIKTPYDFDEPVYRMSTRIDDGNSSQKKLLEFYIAQRSMDELFAGILHEKTENLILMDEAGSIVYTYGAVDKTISQKAMGLKEDYSIEQIGDESYALFGKTSLYHNWRYVLTVTTDHLFYEYNHEHLTEFVHFYLLTFGILFVIALLCSAAAAVTIYKPVWKIFGKIIDTAEDGPDFSYGFNDLMYIGKTVDEILKTKNENFTSSVLLNLLWGQYDDAEQAEMECEEASVSFLYDAFIVGVLKSDRYSSAEVIDSLKGKFKPSELIAYAVVPWKKASGYFILNFDSRREELKKALIDELNGWSESVGSCCRMGLSDSVGDLMHLNRTFSQAKSACRYVSDQPETEKNIAVYSEMEFKISSVQLAGLKKSAAELIAKGDEVGLFNKLDQVLDTVPEDVPFETGKFAVYGIISAFSEAVQALNLPFEEEINRFGKWVTGASSQDSAHMQEGIYDIAKRLCSYAKENADSDDDALLEQINSIIERRMCDQMLTLETFAEECHVSSSYLGRYFKQKIGITPMKYINMQKMDYVKKLLRETDMPLREIVEKSGYIDVSNFIRKFKTEMGMTPMHYRKAHRDRETFAISEKEKA